VGKEGGDGRGAVANLIVAYLLGICGLYLKPVTVGNLRGFGPDHFLTSPLSMLLLFMSARLRTGGGGGGGSFVKRTLEGSLGETLVARLGYVVGST